MSEKPARARNARIEALRLVAIAGIAVFHTFQPWFAAATDGAWAAGTATLGTLGCVNLLGAFGNNVFFLISGLFLVPAAARASSREGFWRDQARRTLRRAAVIGVTVALYGTCALAVSSWVLPLPGVSLHETGWLLGGLEFIWVYLVVVTASPVIGWVWARLRRPRAVAWALVAVTFAVNAYIAFFSPGDEVRGLLEWRKLMSALTYLVAFLAGGALADARPAHPERALGAVALAAVALEGGSALAGNLWLIEALSFKSTSLLSFALAALCVLVARGGAAGGAGGANAIGGADAAGATDAGNIAPSEGHAARLVRALTPSILGFYVMQSLFHAVWRPVADAACSAGAELGDAGIVLLGTAASLAILAVSLLLDRLVRVPLLRALGLA